MAAPHCVAVVRATWPCAVVRLLRLEWPPFALERAHRCTEACLQFCFTEHVRLQVLPLVCKRFRRLLSDPNDRHMWSHLYIGSSYGTSSEYSYRRYLTFLRSHLHNVEVVDLDQVGDIDNTEMLQSAFSQRENHC